MKWLFVLLLAIVIFGGAAFFSYNIFVKQEIAVRAEQRSDVAPQATPDFGLAEFRAAQGLKENGRLSEARAALTTFLERYPTGNHSDEAKDLLGELNLTILLSRYPAPGKTEYTVKKGDVIARVAARDKIIAGIDHADEQYEGHHAAHRRPPHDRSSEFFAFCAAQRTCGRAAGSRSVFQALPCA